MQRPALAGVVGAPVAHSLSPAIHNEWAVREGRNAHYVPVHIEPDDQAFADAIKSLKTLGFRGVNVTLPHKERAFAIAHDRTAIAEKIGAANMLTFTDKGIVADNSDAYGFASSLDEVSFGANSALSEARVLVLGAGGSARAVLTALKDIVGCGAITIVNRTRERAETIAELGDAKVDAWEKRAALAADADIIVNTTSLGMTGKAPLDMDLSQLRSGTVAVDIIYSPLETQFLKDAKAAGARTVNGLEMLMHQAIPGYRAWLGETAVVDAPLREKLISILKNRAGP